ncbi:hypothetical protein, partial [Streptomyces sp. bgisy126]|uniref:hypothetical protein n=1 Tax=Streptomyces sp. bgisy126 TaxID=3413787 RepID=UPI003EBD2345
TDAGSGVSGEGGWAVVVPQIHVCGTTLVLVRAAGRRSDPAVAFARGSGAPTGAGRGVRTGSGWFGLT